PEVADSDAAPGETAPAVSTTSGEQAELFATPEGPSADTPSAEAGDAPDAVTGPQDLRWATEQLASGIIAGLNRPAGETPSRLRVVEPEGAPRLRVVPPREEESLSRPERMTFEEIANRLGARITGERSAQDSEAPPPSEADATGEEAASVPETPAQDLPLSNGLRVIETGGARRSDARSPERATLDRLPLAIIVFRGGEALYVNRAALELTHLHDLGALKSFGIERLFEDGLPTSAGPVTLARSDGERIPVAARLQTVPWDGGTAALLSLRELEAPREETAGLDITTRSLAARISELEALLSLATDGVVTLERDGTIRAVNPAVEGLFGFSASDLAGRHYGILFAETDRIAALDHLSGVIDGTASASVHEGREFKGRAANGSEVPLLIAIGRLDLDKDDLHAAVLRNMSRFKSVEAELIEARRTAELASAQKSNFLARVSHEIRTPLNAVIGFSEVMMSERFGPIGSQRYRDYVADIHTTGEYIMSLVNDLLDLSKIEAGKLDLNFTEIDLNDIVQQCLAIMQPQAGQSRVIIRTSLPTSVPKVVADARSMRQILLNLLSNAIKFTPEGGQVIVSTIFEPTGEVALRVRDNGRGMTESEMQLALEPFRQVATSQREGMTGTGLGLPLTKALSEANRASFSLESALGQGTLARVTFPPQRVLAE
ncbi:MAG: PAS domain S-box protein, partial [Hyphomicrobiaceae bacterium]|nr:PAS domain S-box protein [Hyphomicrobiaceae bacterium]